MRGHNEILLTKRIWLAAVLVVCFVVSCQSLPVKKQDFESSKGKPVLTEKIFSRGEALYQKQCSVCHGTTGGADGKAAYLLFPKPRDFVKDKFRLVTTKNMEATDEDIFRTITRGMAGSSMPPWGHLKEEDRWALVYFVRYLTQVDPYRQSGEITSEEIPWELKEKMINKKIDSENLIKVPSEPVATEEALQKGRELFVASCAGCHGMQGRGDGQQEMKDNLGYPTRPRDLVAGIFKGASSSDELYCRMVGGMPGTPFPSYSGVFTEEQIWNLIHYVQTLPEPGAEERARLKHHKLLVQEVKGDIDLNPSADYWSEAEPAFVSLTPLWWRNDRIEGADIKAVHNEDKIAFLMTWSDPTPDSQSVVVQEFSDGAALQFSEAEDPPFFGMGDSDGLVYIWHWKAAWDKKGADWQDIETQYPHAAIDFYESQTNYEHGSAFETVESKTIFHDPQYTAGWGAGNPLSDPARKDTAEEAAAKGMGSYTTQRPTIEKVDAKGIWADGKWQIVFIRSVNSSEKGALKFESGKKINIAFAIWDGDKKDRNGQKSVSIWNELILE